MKRLLDWLLIVSILMALMTISCDKDDALPEPEPEPEPEEIPEDIPEASDVNKFIWESLAIYYYWVDNVPNLINPKFNKKDSLNSFLNKYSDPEELFYSLLYKYKEVDRWSVLFDDHNEIDDWLSGISESMGFEYIPYGIGTNEVVCHVIYVLKDSPAERAGIKRGNFILKVNGTQLTPYNYRELLHSQSTNTLHMADINGNDISLNGITHTITAEVIQENPIFLDTVYVVDGLKVGYLVYNGFTSAYDEKLENSYDLLLNDIFNDFLAEGIDKLILDLRYNLGGSIQTAVYLASMIYSTDKNKILAKTQYNDLIEEEIIKEYGESVLIDYFTDLIYEENWNIRDASGTVIRTVTTPETPIVNLNLNELYVITSYNTASASELLINGLKPYNDITVKCIGANTRGKNVGSWPIKDCIEYDENGKCKKLNPDHTYGMQLIVAKIANAEGYSEYINGLPPDIEAEEDIRSLLPFGDSEETLLKAALDNIKGIPTKSALIKDTFYKPLKISKERSKLSYEMYLNQERIMELKEKIK